MEVTFQHPFIEQHITHRFRNYHINILRKGDLLNFSKQYCDLVRKVVASHQQLEEKQKQEVLTPSISRIYIRDC